MSRDPFLNQSLESGSPQMPQLRAGQRLFNQCYELLRPLGAGGMGVVWLARDHTEETDVALKFLPSVLVLQESEMRRLREEVRAGKELRHPRLVATYGLEVEDGTAAIAMEYVPGQTLKEKLEAQDRGFFEPEELADWVRDICAGLAYVHGEAKRIHRDLKPANIIVDAAGHARLMDFGISHRIKEGVTRHSKTSEGPASGGSSSTLAYACPQQLSGKPGDKADDIYSLGAALYEMLTGTPPFFRGDAELVRGQIKHEPVTPIDERRAELVAEGLNTTAGQSVPAAVESIVQACLAKSREERPAKAQIVCDAFAAERGPLSPLSGTPALKHVKHAKTTPSVHSPGDVAHNALTQTPRAPLSGLSGPLWAAATVGLVVAIGAWILFAKPSKQVPQLVVESGRTGTQGGAPEAGPPLKTMLGTQSLPAFPVISPAATQPVHLSGLSGLLSATREAPFTNSLGMKFIPVPIGAGPSKNQRVLFSIWETRSKDYVAFVRAIKAIWHDAGADWRICTYGGVPVGRGADEMAVDSSHPVQSVSHDDAVAFCDWLTKEDRGKGIIGPQDEYRLPTDVEWSYAVGIGENEDASASPKDKVMQVKNVYPWGNSFPPPSGSGNYADSTAKALGTDLAGIIEGYADAHATTAPVGSFKASAMGIHDLGGNVWEWTSSPYEAGKKERVLRGGSWRDHGSASLLSSHRSTCAPTGRYLDNGFRCVLVVSGG